MNCSTSAAARGYPAVARGVHRNLPSLIASRARYPQVSAPVHLIYGEKDCSRPSDRQANRRLLPDAEFTQLPEVGHFIALERPGCAKCASERVPTTRPRSAWTTQT